MPTNIDTLININNRIMKFLNNNVFLYELHKCDIHCDIKFDCNMWSNGLTVRVNNQQNDTIVLKPISGIFIDILTDIECNLEKQLMEHNNSKFAYKSQIERLLCTVVDLKNKIISIKCINRCNDGTNIMSHLLNTIVQTILLLMNILEVILGLGTQNSSCNFKSDTGFNLFMGILVNKITELQILLKDWNALVINFLTYSSVPKSPYVVSYIPKQPIPMPNPPIQNSHICAPNKSNSDYNLINMSDSYNYNGH